MGRPEVRRALLFACTLLGASAAPGAEAPAVTTAGNPLESLRLEDLAVTRERPLFSPTRRPSPAPVVVREPPPFDLVGAVVGENMSFALLRNRATSEVLRLRPGDDAEGWRVGAVSIRSVALERDGHSEMLTLKGREAAASAMPASEVAKWPTGDAGEPPSINSAHIRSASTPRPIEQERPSSASNP